MSKPAARVGDMHTCPMVTPGTPPVPHVGGPILPPGEVKVLIGGAPAAVVGNQCTCVGPPDAIAMGSTGVFIGGKPAVRQGDSTTHGGVITAGCATVLIGETGEAQPPEPPVGSARAQDCLFTGISIQKTNGWLPLAPKHKDALELPVKDWVGTPYYEVISGEDKYVTEITILLDELETKCSIHQGAIIDYQDPQDPSKGVKNQKVEQKILYPYQFSMIGGFFNAAPLTRGIRFNSCKTGYKKAYIRVFPNIKIELKIDFKLDWKNLLDSGHPDIVSDLSLEAEWNNSKGKVSGKIKMPSEFNGKFKWSFDVEGEWGKFGAKPSLRQLRSTYEIAQSLINGKTGLDALLSGNDYQIEVTPKNSIPIKLGCKLDLSWENEESQDGFLVFRKDKVSLDTYLEIDWERDFSEKLLMLLPGGVVWTSVFIMALSYLRQQKKGDLYAKLIIKGKLELSGFNLESQVFYQGETISKKGPGASGTFFIGIEAKIGGNLRVGTKSAGVEVGAEQAGLEFILDAIEIPAKFKIKFTGLKLYGMFIFEDADVSSQSTEKKHTDEYVPGFGIEKDKVKNENKLFLEIDPFYLLKHTLGK